MPSAKQIAWRKKFARMSKAGKFKKSKSGSGKLIKIPPKLEHKTIKKPKTKLQRKLMKEMKY